MQLAIADHIQFAMQRLATGQRLEHAMLWELKSTYRREFTAALEMLEMIHASTGVVMPVDEAAFLTMHLVNAELNGDMSTTREHDHGGPGHRGPRAGAARRAPGAGLGGVRAVPDPREVRGPAHRGRAAARRHRPRRSTTWCGCRTRKHTSAPWRSPGTCADRYDVDLPEEELLYLMVHVNRLRHRDVATS